MGTALESRYLTDRTEVARVFEHFRDQQTEVTLRFDDFAQPCRARVLDLQGDFVLLQNVIPPEGAKLLEGGASFSVSGRAEELFVYITDNTATQASTPPDAYAMPLPSNALYQQRRRTTRHRLPVRLDSGRAHLRLGERNPYYASILDLSTRGARLLIEPARRGAIRVHDEFSNSHLLVPDALSITMDAVVRHANYDPNRCSIVCGIEFVNPGADERARLAEFIQSLPA